MNGKQIFVYDKRIIDKVIITLLPIGIFPSILSLIELYINPMNNNLLHITCYWGVLFLYFILLNTKIISIIIEDKKNLKGILKALIIPAIFVILYTFSFFQSYFNIEYAVKNYLVNMFFVMNFSLTIYYIIKTKAFEKFMNIMVYLIYLCLPSAIFYVGRMFLSDEPISEKVLIGNMSYMTFANLMLICILVIVFMFITNRIENENNCKKVIFCISPIISSVAILISGTRSTSLCIIAMVLSLIIYFIIIKSKKIFTLILMVAISLSVVFVDIDKTNADRFFGFISNLNSIEYNQETKDENENINEAPITNSDADELGIGSTEYRKYLMSMTFKEFSESKIIGKGPLYFQNTYEIYPHAPIFELMSDFGTIGLLIFIIAYITAVIVLFIEGKKKPLYACPLIYMGTYFPILFTNHSVYSSLFVSDYIILFYISFCVIKERIKKNGF